MTTIVWDNEGRALYQDPIEACMYVINCKKGRMIEQEPIIRKSSKAIYLYAKYVINGRWFEAEADLFLYDPCSNEHYTLAYAYDIVKDRWKEAEPYFFKTKSSWNTYLLGCIKDEFKTMFITYLYENKVLS